MNEKWGSLTEMSLEELWRLFPVILKPYNSAWPTWYETERGYLIKLVGPERIFRINHIGSTAVEGLTAKPTIDILLETTDFETVRSLIDASGEWICMSAAEKQCVFNKGYTPQGLAERSFHLHLRLPGDWDELYFRDLLRASRVIAEEYTVLKTGLQLHFEHDRNGYTAAKSDFIRQRTELARRTFGMRYRLGNWTDCGNG